MTSCHLFALPLLAACFEPSVTSEPAPAGELRVDVSRVDLGAVLCGTTQSKRFTIANIAKDELDVAILPTLAGVTVSPDHVVLSGFSSATIEVAASAPIAGIPGHLSAGDLVIGSNAGSTTIPLTFETAGAVVDIASQVDFGEMVPFARVTRTLNVSVQGTAGATVALGAPPAGFSVIGSTSKTIEAGSSATFGLAVTAGAAEELVTGALPITVTGNLCAAPPASTQLSARSTNELLTVSATSLDFGLRECGDTSTKTIELTNHGATDTFYQLTRKDPNDLLLLLNGVLVEPGEVETITVHHRNVLQLEPGFYTAALDLSWNSGSVKRTFPVQSFVGRANTVVHSPSRVLGDVVEGVPTEVTFIIQNFGNVTEQLVVEPTGDIVTAVSPQSLQIAAGQLAVVFVSLTPGAAGTQLDELIEFRGKCNTATATITGSAIAAP
jgi:hypothetical protein